MLLKSPELDLRLVVTDYGNTVYRAKLVAKLLEVAGANRRADRRRRSSSGDKEGAQAEWVRGYDLASYPGRVHEDGVQALDRHGDGVEGADDAHRDRPAVPTSRRRSSASRGIASRLRLAGMFGSIHRGYAGKAEPEPEWNVKADPKAARALFAAPWIQATLTPLDTCGLVQLQGARYARVRDSKDPLVGALLENYRLWCPQPGVVRQGSRVRRSPELDPLRHRGRLPRDVAQDLVRSEELGVRVTDEGMTVPDAQARKLRWATQWKSLDGFEELLATRLTGPTVTR